MSAPRPHACAEVEFGLFLDLFAVGGLDVDVYVDLALGLTVDGGI